MGLVACLFFPNEFCPETFSKLLFLIYFLRYSALNCLILGKLRNFSFKLCVYGVFNIKKSFKSG